MKVQILSLDSRRDDVFISADLNNAIEAIEVSNRIIKIEYTANADYLFCIITYSLGKFVQ